MTNAKSSTRRLRARKRLISSADNDRLMKKPSYYHAAAEPPQQVQLVPTLHAFARHIHIQLRAKAMIAVTIAASS